MFKELLDMVNGVESAFKVALNVTPKDKLDLAMTDDKAVELCAAIVRNAQGKMITEACLRAAIMKEPSIKVRNRIMRNALEMIEAVDKEQKGV